ncbi:acyl-CoA thioesterase [Sandaracinus amylolyticus]|uniref:acyl-CoA thioesterase n=1 Tax=Sandaracinus amylolyticus TaxID=927083 RepID=UPI00069DF21A|nr:thioesterase family protein [Sandaracinus amylolyticus]
MSNFEALSTPRRGAAGPWEWTVPDGWQQGRGAFGGLVIATMVRAIDEHVADPERTVRSLTVELPGATLVGAAEIAVETLRAGSGQSTVAARLTQGDELRAHCVAVSAKARAGSEGFVEASAPRMTPWRDVPAVDMSAFGPPFSKAFEYRNVGPLPFTSGATACCEGWVRMREPGAKADAAWCAAMLDAWWPTLFSRSAGPRPMGTVAFTMQVLCDLREVDPTGTFAYRAWTPVAHEGWVLEMRELWDEQGNVVAMNQQTFAVIK